MSVTTAPAANVVRTPGVRRVIRSLTGWFLALLFVLIIGVVTLAANGGSDDAVALSPDSAAPGGTRAVAEVLRDQGVAVTSTTSLADTRRAVGAADDTTLVIYDPNTILTPDQLADALALSTHVVLLEPTFGTLQATAPAIALAGPVDGDLTADCDTAAVTAAGTVSGGGSGYRVIDDAADARMCLGSGDGVYSLVRVTQAGGDVTALGTTTALTNDAILSRGNAAFALGVLGERAELVWFLPSLADVAGAAPTPAELAPNWVTPGIVLIGLVVLAAALWRGRRFGPLVVEHLPSVVRASETMEGRARLYEKNSARLRAIDAIRIGTVQRLAATCGLPRTAGLDEVVHAVASALSRPVIDVRVTLVDSVPETDRELVALSDRLAELEAAVATATRPS